MSNTTRNTMNGKPVFTVPTKTVINFKSHFREKLLCDGLTFTAGTACPYSCSFCYVPDVMRKQMQWLQEHGVTGKHEDIVIRRDNAVETMRKQILSKPESFRNQNLVIYASPLTDVAANMELVRETVELCKVILELTNWDIRLLSKSNLLPKIATGFGDYELPENAPTTRAVIGQRIIYGVSAGTLDDNLAAAFEQGTPKVSKRIESLHWLQDNGYRTFGMICPSLPQVDYLAFSRCMADAIRVDKCEHVWAEVINVRRESFTRTREALFNARYTSEASMIELVSNDKAAWENYSRRTFEAHTSVIPGNKLRFLQYVTKDKNPWWKEREKLGAVLL